jgi:oligoendopeptidase F
MLKRLCEKYPPVMLPKPSSMRNSQDHQELFRKVSMYLDNELTKESERELLQLLDANPSYLEVLSKERSFREFIKSRLHRRKVSPAVIQNIKEKIRIAPA